MSVIFQIVYLLLKGIAHVTGLTYEEVNIVAYYIVLPFVYVFLADRIWGKHLLKILYLSVIFMALWWIDDFTRFSDILFRKSVEFLLSFEFLGWNYIVSSVLICVVFPGIVFLVMLHWAYPTMLPNLLRRSSFSSSSKCRA